MVPFTFNQFYDTIERMNEEDPNILTVARYLDLVNQTLAMIPNESMFVVGEIVDYRVSQGKWINFDLKDEEEQAKISCFMTTYQLQVPLESGMKVKLRGKPKVYERFGKFSLTVDKVELVGEGALAKAYAMLKKKLEWEGLFDTERKRSIPRFPAKIGVITSSEAAAYGDFLRILNNRWSGVEVIHIPVHVQGKNAVPEIIAAFKTFATLETSKQPDVLVLTRGGGSLEDLHAFNDEQVARAVFTSKIPVVCGVGHERDESLCDFVADIRASTPSNAAEIVVPDRESVLREIDMSVMRHEDVLKREIESSVSGIDRSVSVLERYIESKVNDLKVTITQFGHAFERFRLQLLATRKYIEDRERIVRSVFKHIFDSSKQSATALIRLFKSFDTQNILDRGFSIVRSEKKVIRDASGLALGDRIQVQLAKGTIDADIVNGK